jgi:hypothetical protein
LAEIHKVGGVSPGMFDVWMQALLHTVEALDPKFDELTELAWCWALAPGITYMKLRLIEDPHIQGSGVLSL